MPNLKGFEIILIVFLIILNINNFTPYFNDNVDKDLMVYYDDYMKLVKENCNKEKYYNISHHIYKGKVEEGNIAECHKMLNKYDIIVSGYDWDYTKEHSRRSTMYHELSHCVFDIDHSESITNYMYFADMGFEIKNLDEQVIRDIKENCK